MFYITKYGKISGKLINYDGVLSFEPKISDYENKQILISNLNNFLVNFS